MSEGLILLITGAMLTGGLAASLLAGRLRVPGLVLVLGLGMAIGSEGLGGISFNDYTLARRVGVGALSLVLLGGGRAGGGGDIRPVFGAALSLAVVGTVITGVIAGLAAASLFHLSTIEGLLLGSILASTDGAAVFAVLRGSTLRRRLARTLEGEAGLNDPVAVVLVIGFIDWATHRNYGLSDLLVLFVRQFGIGAAIGAVVAGMAVFTLRHARLPSAGLYPVASLAFGALAYGGADVLHGSGFLAVYMTGLAIGSSPSPAQGTIATFHDGLAWVAQLVLFLVLGLLLVPYHLAVVVSTIVQGTTFQPFAKWLGVTTTEAALPAPLIESTAIRRLGAEVVEFVVEPDHAAAGRMVRELGLPRDALLNIIIRGDQALPPRGSTRIEPGDHLHVLVRQEAAIDFRPLLERWRNGPLGRPPRPKPGSTGPAPGIFASRPWGDNDGDPSRPRSVGEFEVVDQLRTRRDQPGALVVLSDGRYAYTGPITAIGSAGQVQDAARRRLRLATTDAEQAWGGGGIGALAEPWRGRGRG